MTITGIAEIATPEQVLAEQEKARAELKLIEANLLECRALSQKSIATVDEILRYVREKMK